MKGSAKILRGGLINEVICARVALVTLASRLITLVVSPWGRDERNFLKKLIGRKCPAVSGKTISKILDGKIVAIVDREVGAGLNPI